MTVYGKMDIEIPRRPRRLREPMLGYSTSRSATRLNYATNFTATAGEPLRA
jgi:hypothetical protein